MESCPDQAWAGSLAACSNALFRCRTATLGPSLGWLRYLSARLHTPSLRHKRYNLPATHSHTRVSHTSFVSASPIMASRSHKRLATHARGRARARNAVQRVVLCAGGAPTRRPRTCTRNAHMARARLPGKAPPCRTTHTHVPQPIRLLGSASGSGSAFALLAPRLGALS